MGRLGRVVRGGMGVRVGIAGVPGVTVIISVWRIDDGGLCPPTGGKRHHKDQGDQPPCMHRVR